MDSIVLHAVLLGLTVIFSCFAVTRARIIRAAVMLAIVSILVTIILFALQSPLAAIFELSVCAGLITVIFISVISLTDPLTKEERREESENMFKRFVLLPIIVIVCAFSFMLLSKSVDFAPVYPAAEAVSANSALWDLRQLDLIGQIIIILAGVFGVIVLFKDNKGDK